MDEPVVPIVDDFVGQAYTSYQTAPSPLAFQHDLLVQLAGEELWFWDSKTMTRNDAIAFAYRHFCFLDGATLVAYAQPPDVHHCQLHRIDAHRNRDVLIGPIVPRSGITHLLPAGSPSEVYVTQEYEVIRYRMTKHAIEEITRIEFPNGVEDELLSLGDGRLLYPDHDELHVIEPGKPTKTYATPGHDPIHLAAASEGRVWYTHLTAKWDAQLVLARLAASTVPERSVAFRGRVIHLASGGGAAAVLVFSVHGMNDLRWTVVVVDESGTERWRAEVPADFARPFPSLNNVGFVAISEHRVVLRGNNHALIAWDATTGSRIN